MKPTTLWLARHGQTIWTVDDKFNGWSDIPLTENGRAQARGLGNWLKDKPLAAIYCSPLSRCVETAQLAGAPHGLEPIIVPEFKELDYGAWDGMARPDIIARYSSEWNAWVQDPAGQAAPEGETGYAVLARVAPQIKTLVTRHACEMFLVVAHKAVNRLLLCDFLGVPPRHYRQRIGQTACALNCVRWIDDEPRVELLNSTAHYEG